MLNSYLEGRKVDVVIANKEKIDPKMAKKYETEEQKDPVKIDYDELEKLGVELIEDDLVIKDADKRLDCTPPHDVPLQPFHPLMVKAEVSDAQETAELLNELILKSQQILADHPINRKRMAEGKDPLQNHCRRHPFCNHIRK